MEGTEGPRSILFPFLRVPGTWPAPLAQSLATTGANTELAAVVRLSDYGRNLELSKVPPASLTLCVNLNANLTS